MRPSVSARDKHNVCQNLQTSIIKRPHSSFALLHLLSSSSGATVILAKSALPADSHVPLLAGLCQLHYMLPFVQLCSYSATSEPGSVQAGTADESLLGETAPSPPQS